MVAELVNTYGMEIIAAILTAIFGYVGMILKKSINTWLDTQEKKTLAKTAVQFVEQVFVSIHGPEKMKQAMLNFSTLLDAHGVKCSEQEMEMLLEAAVAEMNKQAGIPAGEDK